MVFSWGCTTSSQHIWVGDPSVGIPQPIIPESPREPGTTGGAMWCPQTWLLSWSMDRLTAWFLEDIGRYYIYIYKYMVDVDILTLDDVDEQHLVV